MKIASSIINNLSTMHYSKQEETSQTIRFEKTANINSPSELSENQEDGNLNAKLRTTVAILEELTGQKMSMSSFSSESSSSLKQQKFNINGEKQVGWGLEIINSYTLNEEQSLNISSSGKVMTEDGREIDFSLNIQFHREFSLTQSSAFRAGDALSDPLVISLDGSSPIGQGRFDFDLIKGNDIEHIPYLADNNGFLTLDKNNDGKVNDGSELFGPKSGDGFIELAELDEDKNGWIDENDSAFKSLKLWFKTAEDDRTITLKEAGIGALSLSAIDGNFDFKDSSNTTLAQLQKTSVALTESGEARPLFGLNVAI